MTDTQEHLKVKSQFTSRQVCGLQQNPQMNSDEQQGKNHINHMFLSWYFIDQASQFCYDFIVKIKFVFLVMK